MRGIHDLGAADNTSKRHAAGDALSGCDQVGHEVEGFACEISAGAGDTGLNLVGDEDDVVLGAPCLQSVEVAICGNHESALALDGLNKDAREVGCANLLFEVPDGALCSFFAAEAIEVRVRARGAEHCSTQRAITGGVGGVLEVHGHGHVGATVVRVVENTDRVLAGVLTGNLDGVLNCFSARVHQHSLLGVGSRGVLGQKFGNANVVLVRGDREAGVGKASNLALNRLDNCGVGVADRGHANARCHVNELIAIDVDDDRAVSALDVDGKSRANTVRDSGLSSIMHRL